MGSLLGGCTWWTPFDAHDPGPLRAQDEGTAFGAAIRVEVGRPQTYSYMFLRNVADEPLTLASIRPIEAVGLHLVGALVGTPPKSKNGPPTGGRGFPPDYRYELEPMEGFVMQPERSVGPEAYQLSVGLEADVRGVSTVRGFEITYRFGDDEYVEVVRQAIGFCAPRDAFEDNDRCDSPEPVGLSAAA